jgi:carboxyl-terminal processing protease
MKKIIIILSAAITGFSSCQKVLLPAASNNAPTKNFDEMWKGYNEWYGTFEVRHINWDSLYNIYRPQVNDNMSNTALYNTLGQLITPLNDIHAFLQPTSDELPRYESNEFIRTHKVQQDFSIDVIKQNYLPTLTTVDENLQYGILNGNIGYIHFAAFDMPVKFYEQQMNTIMPALQNTRGIIVDIRNHGGGDDRVSRYVAGWFAQERKLFMTVCKRNGTARNNFTAPEYWYVEKQGSFQYAKPVRLLTTRWTASAGETFTWAMNTQAQVKQMGDTTAGGFTDVISRELPNGWLYFVGVGDYRNANGESEEGKGVPPSIRIINTKADIDARKDKVLEMAIEQLK